MPALEPLRCAHVVADPAAIDDAHWYGVEVVLRLAPDEALGIGEFPDVETFDEHQIEMREIGFVWETGFAGCWLDHAELERDVLPHVEWSVPTERPALVQGAVAGVPAKIWLSDDKRVLVLTWAAYAHELSRRLGWSR